MPNLVILGAQWGDEGKGKIVNLFSKQFDVVVRFHGGSNAGHTIVVENEKTVLHQIPSGILDDGPICVIANGCVVDPEALMAEIEEVESKGHKLDARFFLSSRAALVMPFHKKLDLWAEAKRGGEKIGTTGRGIGPAYEAKASREGLRAGDLLHPDVVRGKLAVRIKNLNELAENIYGQSPIDSESVIKQMLDYGKRLAPYITNTTKLLLDLCKTGKSILFEGAQGTMLDIDHGTYPYVTSSSTTIGGVCTGTGLPPKHIDSVLGIAKAYCTRVGEGPFPTEDLGDEGEQMRRTGGEYGSTTGRPRRCGWFDAVAMRYAVEVNGIDAVAMMKVDVLDQLDEIKICVAYELNGNKIEYVPDNVPDYQRCVPVYETISGWKHETAGMTNWADLPENARRYVEHIEELLGIPVAIISTGPDRNHSIIRKEHLDTFFR